LLVVRSLNSELAFVRHALPQGDKGVTIKDRQLVSPTEVEVKALVDAFGAAAKPGDRAQVTSVDIKGDRIVLQLNGGPEKKGKWYQHIQVSAAGGTVTPSGAPEANPKNSHGAVIVLLFDTKFVPEMTGDQVRQLLWPVLDFGAKSAQDAYLDTVPPKAKEAIKNHQVLVGMNQQMVMNAKGRPERKIREHDQNGKEYEEWLYGEPPREVQFVRFQGDEVVRLEIMPVDGEKIVRTEKEVDVSSIVAQKQSESQPAPAPSKAPSLLTPEEKKAQEKPLPRGAVPQDEDATPVLLPPSPQTQSTPK